MRDGVGAFCSVMCNALEVIEVLLALMLVYDGTRALDQSL